MITRMNSRMKFLKFFGIEPDFTLTTFLTIPLISISHSIMRDFSVSNFDFPILLNSWTRDDTGIELSATTIPIILFWNMIGQILESFWCHESLQNTKINWLSFIKSWLIINKLSELKLSSSTATWRRQRGNGSRGLIGSYAFRLMINGPTLSPVALLWALWAPSQYGNFFDFQQRLFLDKIFAPKKMKTRSIIFRNFSSRSITGKFIHGN